MRQRYINKFVSKAVQAFQDRENTPASGTIETHTLSSGEKWSSRRIDLFANIDESKIIYGWIASKGLDAWKRGTVEARKIHALLETATWDQVKVGAPIGRSMWD